MYPFKMMAFPMWNTLIEFLHMEANNRNIRKWEHLKYYVALFSLLELQNMRKFKLNFLNSKSKPLSKSCTSMHVLRQKGTRIGGFSTSRTCKGSNDSPWLCRSLTAALNMGSLPFCGSKYISSNLKISRHRVKNPVVRKFMCISSEKKGNKQKGINNKKLTAYRHLVCQSLHSIVQQFHYPPASWESICYLKYTPLTINQEVKEREGSATQQPLEFEFVICGWLPTKTTRTMIAIMHFSCTRIFD
jgi:hypothetical protein